MSSFSIIDIDNTEQVQRNTLDEMLKGLGLTSSPTVPSVPMVPQQTPMQMNHMPISMGQQPMQVTSAAPPLPLRVNAPHHQRSLSAQLPAPTQTKASDDLFDLDPFRAPRAVQHHAPPSPSQPRAVHSAIESHTTRASPPLPTPTSSADGYPQLHVAGSQDWEIEFNEVKLESKIAEGGFGEVYKGTFRGKPVAVKTVKASIMKKDPRFVKNFTSEIATWAKLRHPNIVMFMGACLRLPEACIVSEFASRGTVYDLLHSRQQISWDMIKRFAMDTALALNYMHLSKPAIIHRDLKSANLLICEDYSIKVIDFGLSRTVESTAHMSTVGTTAWTAPEVLANQPYGTKCDVFSFGILLWEFVTRQVPHAGMEPVQVAVAVVNTGMRPQLPTTCPPAFVQLMQQCWQQNPDLRPPFSEILYTLQQLP